MELDEMKLAWQELDRRIERNEALQAGLRRELSIDRARSALRRWLWLPVTELAISVLAAWLSGGFLAANGSRLLVAPAGALPALVLLILAVTGSAISVRQIVSVATIDYAAPVLAIQRQLVKVRCLRIRLTQVNLLLWLPLWPVFMAFLVQYGYGYGIYTQFRMHWLAANMIFGLALALLLVWIARRYGEALARWRLLRKLSDEIAGRQLVVASMRMEELTRFDRE